MTDEQNVTPTEVPSEMAPTSTREKLEKELASLAAAEDAEKKAAVSKPILQQIYEKVDSGGHPEKFINAVRKVAADLKDAGEFVEEDLIQNAEAGPVLATVVRVVGEIAEKVNKL